MSVKRDTRYLPNQKSRKLVGIIDNGNIMIRVCKSTLTLFVLISSANAQIHLIYDVNPPGYSWVCFNSSCMELNDITDDGINELAIGWPRAGFPDAALESGMIIIYDLIEKVEIDTILPPDPQAYYNFAWSFDIIHDNINEEIKGLIVSAPGYDTDLGYDYSGMIYIFDGLNSYPADSILSPNSELGGRFGWSVAGIGDVDNDGESEFVVSTPWEDPGESPDRAGMAYVYSGDSGELIHELHSQNEEAYGYFGYDIIGLDDVDGDGSGDMAIGAYGEDGPGGLFDAGRVYIVNGGTGGTIRILYSPNAEYSGYFGKAIAQIEDLDQDGIRDVLVGAPWEDSGDSPGMAGSAYVFSAGTGTCIHSFKSYNEEWNGFFGMAVAGTRDIDGDGYGEIAVGAPWEDKSEEEWNAGRVYVFSGGSGELLQVLESPNMQKEGYYGSSITGFGLTGNAGPLALAVGAPGEFDEHGRVYVYSAPVGVDEIPLIPDDYALRIATMPVTDDGTELKFVLPENGLVDLSIYDLNGRVLDRLVNASLERGVHTVRWHPGRGEGIRITSGTYVCTLRCKGGVISRRIVVLR